jgi:membrane-bound lytic murein transglycosylase D
MKDKDHSLIERSTADHTPDADRTVVADPPAAARTGDIQKPLTVTWLVDGEKQIAKFTRAITIGRDETCDVRLGDEGVSRQHIQIWCEAGQWHIADLQSGNGTFLDRVLIQKAVLPRKSTLQLGSDGPKVWVKVPGAPGGASVAEIAEHYFGDPTDGEVGHRTMLVRRAYRKVEKTQKRRYRSIIAGAVGLLSISIGIGIYQFLMLQKTRQLAMDNFYNMKTVQLQVARLEDLIRESEDADIIKEVNARRQEIDVMEAQYDQFLEELGVLGPGLGEEDRIILRVARMFGECELDMPEGFVQEVKNYIRKWKTTGRLRQSLQRMHQHDLAPMIAKTMLNNHLPPQFLYLALHESGFNIQAVGPETRFGIAKGIWQFIPSTARRYGLRTGPLVELPRHDPRDDRFDANRATDAAARYLRDIYNKEAQASGLLVIASYNWGPANIRKRIREMPANPRDRNFWQLLKQNKIPKETYDYVFYIVSAIVIGEDPGLFGFEFENPLEAIDSRRIEV